MSSSFYGDAHRWSLILIFNIHQLRDSGPAAVFLEENSVVLKFVFD